MSAFRKLALCCCLPFGKTVSRRNSRKPSSKPGDFSQQLSSSHVDIAEHPDANIDSRDGSSAPPPSSDSTDAPNQNGNVSEGAHKEKLGVKLLAVLGERNEVDAYELKCILDEALKEYGIISLDACRSMVALGDVSFISLDSRRGSICSINSVTTVNSLCSSSTKGSVDVDAFYDQLKSRPRRSMRRTLTDNQSDISGKLCRNEVHVLFQCIDEWQEAFHFVDSDSKGYIYGHEIDLVLERLDRSIMLSDKILRMMNNRYSNQNGHVDFVDLLQCLTRFAGMMGHYENRVNEATNGKAAFKMDEFIRLHMYS